MAMSCATPNRVEVSTDPMGLRFHLWFPADAETMVVSWGDLVRNARERHPDHAHLLGKPVVERPRPNLSPALASLEERGVAGNDVWQSIIRRIEERELGLKTSLQRRTTWLAEDEEPPPDRPRHRRPKKAKKTASGSPDGGTPQEMQEEHAGCESGEEDPGERALYDTYEVDSFVDESEYQGMAPQEWETPDLMPQVKREFDFGAYAHKSRATKKRLQSPQEGPQAMEPKPKSRKGPVVVDDADPASDRWCASIPPAPKKKKSPKRPAAEAKGPAPGTMRLPRIKVKTRPPEAGAEPVRRKLPGPKEMRVPSMPPPTKWRASSPDFEPEPWDLAAPTTEPIPVDDVDDDGDCLHGLEGVDGLEALLVRMCEDPDDPAASGSSPEDAKTLFAYFSTVREHCGPGADLRTKVMADLKGRLSRLGQERPDVIDECHRVFGNWQGREAKR
eukprot:EG_transcript_12580